MIVDRSCAAARGERGGGLRYDASEVANGASEVLCYGTAVVVAPET
jgi:hypothetical protein